MLDGVPQGRLHVQPVLDLARHRAVEELPAVAPGRLDTVEGGIGVADQGLAVHAILRRQGNARAEGQVAHAAIDLDRVFQYGVDALGQVLHLEREAIDVLHHHRELVAAHACQQVGRGEAAFQALRDLDQHRVAMLMPQAVVERAEVVDVDQHQGRHRPAVAG